MSEGIAAKGAILGIGNEDGPPETFTQIAEVTSISGPSLAADMLDVSSHSSPSGYREFKRGMKDGGEITLELNFVPSGATHKNAGAGLLALFESGAIRNFELTFPDTPTLTKWVMAAIVSGFEPAMPFDDKLSASVTLKVTGVPTLA